MTWLTPRQVSPIGGALDTKDLFMNVPSDLAADVLRGDVMVVDTTGSSSGTTTWAQGVDGSAYANVEEDNTGVLQPALGVYMVALEDVSRGMTGKFRLMGVVQALTIGTGEDPGVYCQVVSSATAKAVQPGGVVAGTKYVGILHEIAPAASTALATMYFNGYGFGTLTA